MAGSRLLMTVAQPFSLWNIIYSLVFPLEVSPKSNLSSMSVDALLKLREDINKTLDHKVHEMRRQLSLLDGASVRRKQARSLIGRKVPPKYRSPSGETWAGRGVQPRWLVAALKKGKKVEDFLSLFPRTRQRVQWSAIRGGTITLFR
jgi:DNA-binding protein H-NS